MKKITSALVILLMASTSVFGQIKVNTSGKSFFGGGTNATSYGSININPEGAAGGLSIIGNTGTPLRIYKYGDAAYINRSGTHNGIKIGSNNRLLISNANVSSINWPQDGGVNILGSQMVTLWTRFEYTSNGGSALVSEVNNPNSYTFTGYYHPGGGAPGGGITFQVKGDGTVYAKNGYLQLSDVTEKSNIRTLSSALTRIDGLRAVAYNYNDAEQIKKAFVAGKIAERDSMSLAAQIVNNGKGIAGEVLQQMEEEAGRERIGLIAQEVEKVIPEVVRTLPDGKKGIMYTELIPLLIEGIKELKTIVEDQQDYISELEEKVDDLISEKETIKNLENQLTDNNNLTTTKAALLQNKPNPFDQQTEIGYQIPENATAYLGIYNLNGMQVKKYPLHEQSGSIIISASEFNPGIYIYSLIVDNQEVDSKRMVLTE